MFSHTILIGRVGQAPEQKTTSNGATYVQFSLATSERWKDKQTGEKKEDTVWHNLVLWPEGLRNIAMDYVSKGDLLIITGQIRNRSWQDDKDNWHNRSEINVREIKLMPNGQRNNDPGPTPDQHQQSRPVDLDDDVPF